LAQVGLLLLLHHDCGGKIELLLRGMRIIVFSTLVAVSAAAKEQPREGASRQLVI
jgi:hypothetical protein